MRYYYDLHIHSALSPCGDEDMTPNNIVNMAVLNGLSVIALSDHNTMGNICAIEKVAEKNNLICLPAMELESAEEIHFLCLFEDTDRALEFEKEVVKPRLPDIKNNKELFGRQLLMDENDNIVGEEDRYLINATEITADELNPLVKKYGGAVVPAHIDKQTKSLMSVFGTVGDYMGYTSLEISKNAPENYTENTECICKRGYNFLFDSDAHYLWQINENNGENFIECDTLTKKYLINMLNQKK